MSAGIARLRLAAGAAADAQATYERGVAATTAAADRMLATAVRLHHLGCTRGARCPSAWSPR